MPKAMIRIRTRPDGSDMDCNMNLKDETGETAAELRIHGGRIDTAALLYPSAPQPWIDLSTGIKPVALPRPPKPPGRVPAPAARAGNGADDGRRRRRLWASAERRDRPDLRQRACDPLVA